MRLKHFLSVFLTLLTLSVGQMWGATYNSVGTSLTSGKSYIIVAGGDYAITASTPSSNWIGKTSVSASISGTVLTTTATDIVWVATAETGGAWSFKNGNNYITNGSGSTYRNMSCSSTKSTFTISNSKIYSTGSTGKWLQGLSSGFRMYNSTQSGALETFVFYELAESCSNSVTLNTGSATNGTISYAGSVETCGTGDNDRKVTISVAPSSGYTLLEATRPTFNKTSGTATASYVSGPTWNNTTSKYEYVYQFAQNDKGAGNFSITCDALPKYKITYNAGSGSCGTASWTQTTAGQSTTLPTATPLATCSDWAFYGWCITSAGSAEDNSTSPGTILTGSYQPTSDVTLYAIYKRTVNSGGSASLTKMVKGNTLSDGDKLVVVANGTDIAMYQETTSSSYVQTWDCSTLNATTVGDDSKKWWTVTATTGGFYLGDATNGYLNMSSNNLYCNETQSVWTLSDLEDGTFRLQSGSRNLSYRSDLSTTKWRMGGTSYGTSGQTVLDLYKYSAGGGSTTYYMTSLVCCSPLGSINGSFLRYHFLGPFGRVITDHRKP